MSDIFLGFGEIYIAAKLGTAGVPVFKSSDVRPCSMELSWASTSNLFPDDHNTGNSCMKTTISDQKHSLSTIMLMIRTLLNVVWIQGISGYRALATDLPP